MSVKSILKSIMPSKLRMYVGKHYRKVRLLYLARVFSLRYKRVEARLKNQKKIKICFFLIHDSVWKLDEVFKLMLNDDRFDPMVVICPYIVYGQQSMLDTMSKTEEFIKSKGYPYVKTFDEIKGTWLDVRRGLKPDIVFFTNPYEGLTREEYYIFNYPKSLTCYVPYSSMICSTPVQFDKPLQNLVWRFFIENSLTSSLLKKTSPTKGTNSAITGFPGMDILNTKPPAENVWKHEQPIKIIWAPHHTIDVNPMIMFSSFIQYANPMINLAEKYKKQIQIAFKPHPLLYSKLLLVWGKEQTDNYYKKWSTMPNTQLETGEYIDLFRTSNAMIFDSVSFINEYLYFQKRSLFLDKLDITDQLNEFGLKSLDCHQKAYTEHDITSFIESLISGDVDPKSDFKKQYYEQYLLAPNGRNASENIFYIIQTLI